ncbi:MAG: hypothetical protein IT579_20450 [Verrucomicrobia subdivision 3 bacterium]|nr:hypothetical protein [Limisphaerales bacterium]
MEFKSERDIEIAEKMLAQPLLGDDAAKGWRLELHREFNMTDDAYLFRQESANGRLPLYEGKMIWHFDCKYVEPRYWINEKEGRKAVLGRELETEAQLDYQTYRLAYRDVTGSTNERTLVSTILPPGCFTGNTLVNSAAPKNLSELLFISAMMNSFAVDYIIRQKVTNHCNMFYVYQLPIPRLSAADATFAPIVKRAAQLICITPEFDALAAEVRTALKLPAAAVKGVTDAAARSQLRAELDALIAHLYGLTESEFAHILTTFPLVDESVKQQTLNTYRDLLRLGKLPDTRL